MSQETTKARKIVDKVFSAEESSAAGMDKEKLSKHTRIAAKMFHTSVLTNREQFAPGIGQFAEKILFGINVYQMLYFVNVLKIDIVYVTIITTLIGIYDVLNNPIMGIAYDRTRTRWGKSKPYLLLSVIPYYLSNTALYSGATFLGERPGNDPTKIIFVFVVLFIRETISTVYSIPRGNMPMLMSPNPNDRVNIMLVQTYIGEFGSQLVYVIFIPLMEMSNKGILPISLSGIFMGLAVFASSIGTIANMYMAVYCKERVMLQPKPADSFKSLFYVFKNKYLLRNFIASFSVSWWSNGGYSWDVVTQQEIFGGTIPTFIAYLPYNILDYLSITFIPKFRKMFKGNTRNALLTIRFWDIFASLGMLLLGLPVIENKWAIVAVYAVFYGIAGFNNGPARVFEQEIVQEIYDYTEYVTGERPDGSITLLTSLISKVTAPLSALFTIFLFKWSGYDSTITMLPWSQGSADVYRKVYFLFVGVGIFPGIINVIPYFFYDILGEKRNKMYVELNERRALIASETSILDQMKDVVDTIEESEEKE